MILPNDTYRRIVRSFPHPEAPACGSLPAAVSLLLIPGDETKLLAIEKAPHHSYTWAGQVALPGGRVDRLDPDSAHAAMRELKEELGIPQKEVELIGSMGHFMTLRDVCIEVWAGWWKGKGPLRPDPSEISRTFDIPLENLLKTHQEMGFSGREPHWRELLYPVEDTVIWGATARIVHHFMECLLAVGMGRLMEMKTAGKSA